VALGKREPLTLPSPHCGGERGLAARCVLSDLEIRARIYDELLRTGRAPTAAELGDREALQRLAAGRVLVLDAAGEILMAPPFSAVPTSFLVHTPLASATVAQLRDTVAP
jgi:hypothetical protein